MEQFFVGVDKEGMLRIEDSRELVIRSIVTEQPIDYYRLAVNTETGKPELDAEPLNLERAQKP